MERICIHYRALHLCEELDLTTWHFLSLNNLHVCLFRSNCDILHTALTGSSMGVALTMLRDFAHFYNLVWEQIEAMKGISYDIINTIEISNRRGLKLCSY